MIKLLLPIVFVLIAIGLFFGFVDPTYSNIKELQNERDQFDQALTKSRELQAIRDTLLSKYNTFSTSDLDRLEKLLPDNVDNVRLVLDIDGIAGKYNLRVKNVVVNTPTQENVVGPNEKPYESVVLNFSVVASYDDFVRFLKDLEASLRIVDVVDMSFNAERGDLYEFDVGIRTYWLK
jgi:Tfp pilus assembly protein PilO|tara:strand:+ start:32024 stop:32557 length:534 start_codon:yes stop_codon:yes gene_type:complete